MVLSNGSGSPAAWALICIAYFSFFNAAYFKLLKRESLLSKTHWESTDNRSEV